MLELWKWERNQTINYRKTKCKGHYCPTISIGFTNLEYSKNIPFLFTKANCRQMEGIFYKYFWIIRGYRGKYVKTRSFHNYEMAEKIAHNNPLKQIIITTMQCF